MSSLRCSRRLSQSNLENWAVEMLGLAMPAHLDHPQYLASKSMSMITFYKRLPPEEIRAATEKCIAQIEDWFESHRQRKVCHAGIWYNQTVRVRRGHVREDMETVRDQALKGEA